jgi:predicted phage terminase large subunit-like protein
MEWDWRWLVYLRTRLAAVTRGEVRKLAVSIPPQHGKSQGLTVRYPLWRMLREPGLRAGIGCYNQHYANKLSKMARRVARKVGAGFGEADQANEWWLDNGSTFIARGVGVGIQGEPVDLFVIDDPFKTRVEADSETIQERVYEWYMDDVTPRVQSGGALIIVHTRWNPGDLIGRIQASEEADDWEFLRIPALAETQEDRDAVAERCGQPVGLPDPLDREPGEAACPERFSADDLELKRRTQGVGFESVYQQNPVPRGGSMFRREWFRVYQAVPPGEWAWVRYWDLASGRKDSSDYTSGVLVGMQRVGETRRFVVADVVRGRWPPGERNRVMADTAAGDERRPGFRRTYFETPTHDLGKEAARAIYSAMAGRRVAGDSPSGKGSKSIRAEPLAAAAEAGLVGILAAPWNAAFLSELEGFPKGSHDDIVDSAGGGFNKVSLEGGTVPTTHRPDPAPVVSPYPSLSYAAQRGIYGVQ